MDILTKNNNVYIVTKEPFPQGMAATNRIICYAKGLISNGIDCKVIITKRTELYTHIKNPLRKGKYDIVPYLYIPKSPIRSKHFLTRRIQDIESYWETTLYLLKKLKKSDYIHLYMPFSGMYLTIIAISKLKGVKITRELCEYPHATQNDSLRKRLIRQIDLKICFPLFTGFIVISNELEKIAKRYGSFHTHIIKIPILIDKSIIQDKYCHPKPYIFHGGTMLERKDAIISTMKAFAKASKTLHKSIDFILVGPTSPHQNELNQIIQENHLEKNVFFKGPLPHKEVIKFQNGASLSILNKNDNVQNRFGFSTKLGEILLSATPVITTTIGEANFFLKNNESAYIVSPHQPDLIAQKIIQAFTNEEERITIGLNGKKIAEKYFDYRYQGERFKEFILNCMNM